MLLRKRVNEKSEDAINLERMFNEWRGVYDWVQAFPSRLLHDYEYLRDELDSVEYERQKEIAQMAITTVYYNDKGDPEPNLEDHEEEVEAKIIYGIENNKTFGEFVEFFDEILEEEISNVEN